MASSKVTLRVNGKIFGGWKSARVSRGIESVAGSFDLTVSERWGGQLKPWLIGEEDACVVELNGTPVITGYVDRRSLSFGAEEHTLSVSGRDRTGDLVDCSAVIEDESTSSKSKWEFRNIALHALARRLCDPFSIGIELVTPSAGLPFLKKFSVDPGESAFDAIERACRLTGMLAVSDGAGALLLMRPGTNRTATALVEGQNILSAGADFDASGRFYKYVALGQHVGSDEYSGASAAQIKGTAFDLNVKRTARTLCIRPEGNVTAAFAKTRAEWEAKVRAGRADAVRITVQGWTQSNGQLWPVNARATVRSPSIGINGDMLITEATYSQDESGTTTQLTLKRPDAFLPEPSIPKDAVGSWKELAKGA